MSELTLNSGEFEMLATPETTSEKATVTYVGRLKDLELGNPEGIPTTLLTPEAVAGVQEKLAESLAPVTDAEHVGCIDGRVVLHNEDGSAPQIRHRQVGGTGVAVETAACGEAPILDTLPGMAAQAELTDTLHSHLEKTIQLRPSAHRGGCGGVNGAFADAKDVAQNPQIAAAVEAVMAVPAVAELTGTHFDAEAMGRVQERAGKLAEWMENSWSGPEFVDSAARQEPAGVEVLATTKDKFHGHAEDGIVIVASETHSVSEEKLKELGLGDYFVWSIKASREMAKALGGQRGEEGYRESLLGNFAKHLATANRLPSRETPIFLVVA